jgi:outer membrane protein assembly factor BamE (lipoprotein component of BamABCDE complex)
VRKKLLILTGVAFAAAVIVPAALEHHAYRQKLARSRLIDPMHCRRVEVGMSRAEVEATLGGPPGDFRTKNVIYLEHHEPDSDWGRRGEWRVESWGGDGGKINVVFDEQGQVRQRSFGEPVSSSPPSLAERLRAWLRRVWP